jgi:lipoate-protein ligase A
MNDSTGIIPPGMASILLEQKDPTRSSIRSPKKDNTWWVLQTGFADAAWNMAVDEWLFNTAGTRPPVLRFYGWQYPTVSLGRHEPWQRVLDLKRVKANGVRLVRRITGGRAVLHHRELDEGLDSTLRTISVALARGLESLGVEAHFRRRRQAGSSASDFCFESASRYELVSQGRKVVGSAQYRSADAFLQHGSIPAYETLADLQTLSPRKRGKPEVLPDQIEPTGWHDRSLDDLANAILAGFRYTFGWKARRMALNDVDWEAVTALGRARYSNPKWTFRR